MAFDNNNNKRIRIVLAEVIPSFNRGEAAILFGLLKTLETNHVRISDFTILSTNAKQDEYWYGENIRAIPWDYLSGKYRQIVYIIQIVLLILVRIISKQLSLKLFKGELWQSILLADLIMIGHDNMFASGAGLWHALICLFAKVTHKPIVMPAGSVNDTKSKLGLKRAINRYILNNLTLVTLRDASSLDYCSKLHLKNSNIHLTSDLAFLLDPSPRSNALSILESLNIPKNIPIFGVTLSRKSSVFRQSFGLDKAGVELNEGEKIDLHVKIMADVFDQVSKEIGAFILFIPHCTGNEKEKLYDDRAIALKVLEQMQHKDMACVIEQELSAPDIKALIGEFDFMVGERMHSVVNAMSMCVPSLCISFPSDPRVNMITEMIGFSGNVYDIRELKQDTLIEQIRTNWEKRSEIRKNLKEIMPDVYTKALKLSDYLNEVIS
jgi:polysaccharide pyruvyl transferase WcaK-like protein